MTISPNQVEDPNRILNWSVAGHEITFGDMAEDPKELDGEVIEANGTLTIVHRREGKFDIKAGIEDYSLAFNLLTNTFTIFYEQSGEYNERDTQGITLDELKGFLSFYQLVQSAIALLVERQKKFGGTDFGFEISHRTYLIFGHEHSFEVYLLDGRKFTVKSSQIDKGELSFTLEDTDDVKDTLEKDKTALFIGALLQLSFIIKDFLRTFEKEGKIEG